MNNIDILEKEKCYGCSGCYNICPAHAIEMHADSEGFFHPVVNEDCCINCGKCIQSCPALHPEYHNTANPQCYAVMAEDSIRKQSSSDGVFTVIAEYILKKGGVVCGAEFSSDWQVRHTIIDSIENLEKLRGSKYVQSNIGKCYNEIKTYLQKGIDVLFCGTPCQVAGLYAFLKNDYENLITVDLVCHGVPSPLVWKKYLEENFGIKNIQEINFRKKDIFGWRASLSIVCKDSSFNELDETNIFYKAFIPCLCNRPSCGNCQFAKTSRQGTITLADFWDIHKFDSSLDDGLGTSMLLLNNSKAKSLFKKINKNFKLCKKVPLEFALSTFNMAIRQPWPTHPNRNLFFQAIKNRPVSQAVSEASENKYDCAISNIWWHANYGAILTCYALQEVLKSMGKTVKVVNYIPEWYRNFVFPNSISEKFANKYLQLGTPCYNKFDLMGLNRETNTFICGSDQVFRYGAEILWNMHEFSKYIYSYFFSYATSEKNLIAYSASFGRDFYEGDTVDTLYAKYYLKRFNHISVREKSGINICKNTFDVNAEFVLDPVFLADKRCYDGLIKNATVSEKNFIAYYILDNSDSKQKILEYYGKKLNLPLIDTRNGNSVENWLYYFKNAEIIITDSFHGICFALIFNKKFIHLKHPDDRVLPHSRFDTIFSLIECQNRSVLDIDDCDKNPILTETPDYEKINKILNNEKLRSVQWLQNALEDSQGNKLNEQAFVHDKLLSLEASLNNIRYASDIALHNQLSLILNKNKVYRKYYCYKLLSKVVPNKKNKYIEYKNKIRQIRHIKRAL